MEHWDIVEKTYNASEIVFLYGGDKMISEDGHNHLTNHLKYHSNKGLCFVREFTAPDILKYKNFNFTSTLSPRLDDYFDQIYIIHLDCLLDRKKSIIEQVKQYGLKNITIIDAINKNDIGNLEIKDFLLNEKKCPHHSPIGDNYSGCDNGRYLKDVEEALRE